MNNASGNSRWQRVLLLLFYIFFAVAFIDLMTLIAKPGYEFAPSPSVPFNDLEAMAVNEKEQLYVLQRLRLDVYDKHGLFVKAISLKKWGAYPSRIKLLSDGAIQITFLRGSNCVVLGPDFSVIEYLDDIDIGDPKYLVAKDPSTSVITSDGTKYSFEKHLFIKSYIKKTDPLSNEVVFISHPWHIWLLGDQARRTIFAGSLICLFVCALLSKLVGQERGSGVDFSRIGDKSP